MYKIIVWVYGSCLASADSIPRKLFAHANLLWAQQYPRQSEPLFVWRADPADGAPIQRLTVMRRKSAAFALTEGDVDTAPNAANGAALHKVLSRIAPLHDFLDSARQRMPSLAATRSVSLLLDKDAAPAAPTPPDLALERAFRAHHPNVATQFDQIFLHGGHVLCTGTSATFIDLSLHLIERLAGQSIAASCAAHLCCEHQRSQQLPLLVLPDDDLYRRVDPVVVGALQWILQRQDLPCTLQAMAIHLNISRRTLIRRFRDHLGTTPNTYVQQHKIELAKRLLETSALSFEAISEQVGYADTGSFRRLFKREMGLTPKQYRLQVAATVC